MSILKPAIDECDDIIKKTMFNLYFVKTLNNDKLVNLVNLIKELIVRATIVRNLMIQSSIDFSIQQQKELYPKLVGMNNNLSIGLKNIEHYVKICLNERI